MKEFFDLLKKFDLKGIFLTPTKNGFLQLFRYLFVGGIATVVDWGVLFGLTELFNVHKMVSAVFGFVAGLSTNYLLSKLLVFRANEARTNGMLEFLGYAVIGLTGLGITELILLLGNSFPTVHYMAFKAVATVVVLAWNYLARKIVLYKK